MGKTSARGEGLDVALFAVPTDDEIKASIKLSASDHTSSSRRCSLRVVCLVDTSGSMLQYCDRRSKRTKLSVVRNFCKLLITVLKRGDEVSLVTFDENASVLLDMTPVHTDQLESRFSSIVQGIKCRGDRTNLSRGLNTAFEQLAGHQSEKETRDIIVIISDGEINAGIEETTVMTMWIKEKVGQHGGAITLATVKIGSAISEVMSDISDNFGSQAYVYLDGRSDNPEIGMMLPILSNQMGTAFSVTLKVTAHEGVRIDWRSSSETYLKHRYKQPFPSAITMFVHDVGQIMSRNLSVILVPGLSYDDLGDEALILDVSVEYSDHAMEWKTLNLSLTKSDIERRGLDAKIAVTVDDVKRAVSSHLTSAMVTLREGKMDKCAKTLEECNDEMAKIKDELVKDDGPGQRGVVEFNDMISERVLDLSKSVKHSPRGTGHKWNRLVALKSAVDRDSIGLPETVEVMLSCKDDPDDVDGLLDLDGEGDQSLCLTMIKEVANVLGGLANTVKKSQTLPRMSSLASMMDDPDTGALGKSASLSRMATANMMDDPDTNTLGKTASLSRMATARHRMRMSTDMNNLLKMSHENSEPGRKARDRRCSWEDILEELEVESENKTLGRNAKLPTDETFDQNWSGGDTYNKTREHTSDRIRQGERNTVYASLLSDKGSTVGDRDSKPRAKPRSQSGLNYIAVEVVKDDKRVKLSKQ